MKEIQLNHGQVTIVDDEDYERLKGFRWYAVLRTSGWYARRTFRKNGLHHFEFLHQAVIGRKPGLVIDHINRDSLDNRRANLRHCTIRENFENSSMWDGRQKTSRYLGISYYKWTRRWRAYMRVNRKRIMLGYFPDEISAALAYNEAARKYFGEAARLHDVREAAA